MPVSLQLLALLVCPAETCHGELQERDDRLVCIRCGLRYRIEDRWPILVPEEAEPPVRS